MLVFAVLVAAILDVASAQSSTDSASPTSTSSTPTHTISVGKDGPVFTPNQLTATVGDIIEYEFYPRNYSVARAEWESPCIPYEYTDLNKQGFFSGFNPLTVVSLELPNYQVRVNDTEPIFFYCSSPGACIQDGMIGVVNPTDEKNFATQQQFARNASLMFSPGQIIPELNPTLTTPSASSPTSTTTISPQATNYSVSKSAGSSGSRLLSTGAIVGISIAGAAALLAVAVLIYLCSRQQALRKFLRSSAPLQSGTLPHPPPGPPSMISPAMNYLPQIPRVDIENSPAGSFGEHHGYDRIAAVSDSQRSRSPPFQYEEHRDRVPMLPVLNLKLTSQGNPSPVNLVTPSPRRPLGESPMSGRLTSPTPIYQMFHQAPQVETLHSLSIKIHDPQHGPHELGTVNLT